MRAKFDSVDEYIASFPPEVRRRLREIRATLRKAAPKAEETISYGIPTLKLNGALIYFAAFKEHISLYPVTSALNAELGEELTPYTNPKRKGTMRFPLAERLPLGLIRRIVKVRKKENLEGSRAIVKKK
ncbi:MAG TPA: DUF1801 domain-containing protein [Vicinamibacteria bacterium]|jgi:uncharacterized protein YdhG (YjbR/CyaY superfamily)